MPGRLSVQKWESTNVYTNASNQIYVLARKQPKKCLPNRGSNVLVFTQKRPSLMNKTGLFKMFLSRWALSSCFAFYGEFLGLPLDQSRRNVLWPLMRQMYLTVNSWAPAPAECLRTVEDRLQSCQAQILQRLVPFPLHGQTRMQINHFTEPVISLMGFHPWLCRLAPPREVVGRVHLFTDREISQPLSERETSFKPSWSHHRSKTARANWSSQLVTG